MAKDTVEFQRLLQAPASFSWPDSFDLSIDALDWVERLIGAKVPPERLCAVTDEDGNFRCWRITAEEASISSQKEIGMIFVDDTLIPVTYVRPALTEGPTISEKRNGLIAYDAEGNRYWCSTVRRWQQVVR